MNMLKHYPSLVKFRRMAKSVNIGSWIYLKGWGFGILTISDETQQLFIRTYDTLSELYFEHPLRDRQYVGVITR